MAGGILFRFIGGTMDPEMQSWSVVVAAPVVGVVVYLQAARKESLLTALLFGTGTVGLVFWSFAVSSGRLPITSAADGIYVAIVFAFPLACLALAVWRWRVQRAAIRRA